MKIIRYIENCWWDCGKILYSSKINFLIIFDIWYTATFEIAA